MVSPLHRIFLQNSHAELLYGSSEVLVAARDLVDGKRVQQIEGGRVEYVHLMFSRHQVIWSDGLPSESFLPGSQTQNCFEQSALEEICEIFPELDPITGEGYGPAARPALKRFEARLLVVPLANSQSGDQKPHKISCNCEGACIVWSAVSHSSAVP